MRLDQTFGQSRHVACASGCRSMRTSLEEGIKLHRFAGIFPEQFIEAGRHREPPSPTVMVVPEDEKLKIHSGSIDEGRARLVLPLLLALPATASLAGFFDLTTPSTARCDTARPSASIRCPPAPCGRHDRARRPVTRQMLVVTDGAGWPCRSVWRAATCARSAAGRADRRRHARWQDQFAACAPPTADFGP